jgi:poly(ADP-ribose) glycohydrolase ARH3
MDLTFAEAAQTLFGGRGSFGNGAAMRIVPLGLFYHDSSEIYELASISAGVTHAHPIGKDGAAIQARAVAQAMRLSVKGELRPQEFVRDLIDFSRTREIRDKLTLVEKSLKDDVSPSVVAKQIGRTVAVQESMPFAVYSFLRYPISFEDCLYCAVLHGGDRDTLGAMACAISGTYLGIEAIPRPWRNKLENGDMIESLAAELAEKSRSSKENTEGR